MPNDFRQRLLNTTSARRGEIARVDVTMNEKIMSYDRDNSSCKLLRRDAPKSCKTPTARTLERLCVTPTASIATH